MEQYYNYGLTYIVIGAIIALVVMIGVVKYQNYKEDKYYESKKKK